MREDDVQSSIILNSTGPKVYDWQHESEDLTLEESGRQSSVVKETLVEAKDRLGKNPEADSATGIQS